MSISCDKAATGGLNCVQAPLSQPNAVAHKPEILLTVAALSSSSCRCPSGAPSLARSFSAVLAPPPLGERDGSTYRDISPPSRAHALGKLKDSKTSAWEKKKMEAVLDAGAWDARRG